MATPNMGLTLPSVSVTTGPQWASLLNAALETIDLHDHTSGYGARITPAAMNINADLDFESYNAYGLRSVRLDNQTATLATANDLRILYSKNGELAYRDSSGNEVILTSGGSVAGTTGSWTGLSSPATAAFSNVTNTFSLKYDTGLPGKLIASEFAIYEYANASANPITIKTPASVASAYSLTLPAALPAAHYPVTMSTSGVLGNSGTVGLADGTSGAPSVTFAAETTTGFYRPASAVVGVVGQLGVANGSTVAPSISFASDLDTGFTRGDANQIDAITGGATLFLMKANSVEMASGKVFYADTGSAATPSLSFTSDVDTGLYRLAANTVGITAGGAEVARFQSSYVGIAGNLDISGGVQTASGGTFKVKVFSGNLTTSSSTADCSITGTIIGVFGWQVSTSLERNMILSPKVTQTWTGAYVQYATAGQTSSNVRLQRSDTSTGGNAAYTLVVVYQ